MLIETFDGNGHFVGAFSDAQSITTFGFHNGRDKKPKALLCITKCNGEAGFLDKGHAIIHMDGILRTVTVADAQIAMDKQWDAMSEDDRDEFYRIREKNDLNRKGPRIASVVEPPQFKH